MADLKELLEFKPAYEFIDDGVVHGIMSKFEPGTRLLKKGEKIDKRFKQRGF